jgi:hypothetical protein
MITTDSSIALLKKGDASMTVVRKVLTSAQSDLVGICHGENNWGVSAESVTLDRGKKKRSVRDSQECWERPGATNVSKWICVYYDTDFNIPVLLLIARSQWMLEKCNFSFTVSVCPHVTTKEGLNWSLWNLVLESFTEFCRYIPILKITIFWNITLCILIVVWRSFGECAVSVFSVEE